MSCPLPEKRKEFRRTLHVGESFLDQQNNNNKKKQKNERADKYKQREMLCLRCNRRSLIGHKNNYWEGKIL